MTISQITFYLVERGVPTDIAEQAAAIISKQQAEIQQASARHGAMKTEESLVELLGTFIELVNLEPETALETLERMLI